MNRSFCLAFCLAAFLAPPAPAQYTGAHTAYRLDYRTVRVPQEVTTYRVERHTVYKPQTVTTYKDVIETSEHVREYLVRKPVYETETRDENYLTCEPQTTYTTQYQDQGGWEAQTVCRLGTVTQRLAWKPGGYAIDPATGAWVWQWAGLGWVTEQTPATQEVQHVWKPNVVAVQVPQTTYVQKVATRKVQVQVMKYVDEVHQERVPVQTCKRVPVQEERQVAVIEERVVPVKQTQYVERVEVYRVAIDPCTGQPLAIAPTAAPPQGHPQPAGPPPQPADPRTFKENGETIRQKPADASGAEKTDAAKPDGAKDDSAQWRAKSSLEKKEPPADPGNVDLKKPALNDKEPEKPQKSVLKDENEKQGTK